MNTRWKIIVTALDGQACLADENCARLSGAWSATHAATFTSCRIDQLNGDSGLDVHSIDALVLVASCNAPQSQVLPLLTAMEEAGVPVLALLDGTAPADNVFEFAGALALSPGQSDDRLCAVLHGMLHGQREAKRLRAEAALNQRFHGGLRGEIAKMHEELQLAAVVQREFLPRETPSLHGVDFAALWRPSNYVSGDIYDVAKLDDDHIGVFVADAVGHGVPAALMTMVMCRSLLTKEISDSGYRLVPPSEVLARLNAEMIRRQGRTTRFSTAVYALVNCRTRMMQLAGAGHPPPLRLAADGTSELLETTGGLLGVFPEETYAQREVELHADDRLLFYTDGFEQAFPVAATDHYERRLPSARYRAEFDQLASMGGAVEIVDAICQKLDDQAGSLHQIDDLTLICMHARPLEAACNGNVTGRDIASAGKTSKPGLG